MLREESMKSNTLIQEAKEEKSRFAFLILFYRQMLTKIKTLEWNRKRSLISGGVVGLVLVLLVITHFYGKSSSKSQQALQIKRNELMLLQLKEINSKLAEIITNPGDAKVQQEAQMTAQRDISDIQKSILDVAKSADLQKLSIQISSMKDDVDTQMSELKKAVTDGAANKQYLDADVLPFHVVAVDVISGQRYVSVNYADHVTPLALGETLAGWRLTQADFDSYSCEFINEKNQYVHVSLPG
jgi:ABC-type multidrug transport system fused ATPase/permease subunit